nr:farnesyl diphosphate synthase [Lignipirellula cremea]
MRHSLLAPGKRLRPILVLMSAEASSYNRELAMPAACAVEMVHAYSLIHDDLPAMDDDDLRRGRPSCHAAFDEATAILAGDALLAQAFETLADGIRPSDRAARCCAVLAKAAGPAALVGGQADDLSSQGEGGIAHLEHIHRRKTGALFRASLQLGAIAAGADADKLQALDTYGEKMGLAFQIVDDLLDLESDEETLGKRTQKDSQQGKLTFPGLLGVDESRRRAEQLIADACRSLTLFGPQASRLEGLAHYVLERKH